MEATSFLDDLATVSNRLAEELKQCEGIEAISAKADDICNGALPLLDFLGKAVIELSNRGKLHQDIKSSNILTADDDSLRLADFGEGIDSPDDGQDFETVTTRLSFLVGSSLYTPYRNTSNEEEDKIILARRDWYAIGVTIWYYLSGNTLSKKLKGFNGQETPKKVIVGNLKSTFSPANAGTAARLQVLATVIYNLMGLKIVTEKTFNCCVGLVKEAFTFIDDGSFGQERIDVVCRDIDELCNKPFEVEGVLKEPDETHKKPLLPFLFTRALGGFGKCIVWIIFYCLQAFAWIYDKLRTFLHWLLEIAIAVKRVGRGSLSAVERVGRDIHSTIERVGQGIHSTVKRMGRGTRSAVERVRRGIHAVVDGLLLLLVFFCIVAFLSRCVNGKWSLIKECIASALGGSTAQISRLKNRAMESVF
ncbi:MAG: hypothetical protein SGARI_001185, partial [Bacillariaceae sp.]